jgi:hypothetical protein
LVLKIDFAQSSKTQPPQLLAPRSLFPALQ